MDLPNNFPTTYTELKFYVTLLTAAWAVFKGWVWLKSIKENDLAHLQNGIDGVHKELRSQTDQIVAAVSTNTQEMKELRRDLFTALVHPSSRRK